MRRFVPTLLLAVKTWILSVRHCQYKVAHIARAENPCFPSLPAHGWFPPLRLKSLDSRLCRNDKWPNVNVMACRSQSNRLARSERLHLGFFMLAFLGLVVSGCSQTHQARQVNTSGFLQDYSMLQPGNEGEALLVYHNPEADFSIYNKVFVDPIFVWIGKNSKTEGVPPGDLQRLADELRSKVIWQIKQDYLVVPTLEAGVMRIQIAITEAGESNVGLDVLSTLVPGAGALSTAQELATGTQAFVGSASVEGKITDSSTGETLFAAVDRRVGGRTLDGSMDSWDDVRQAFDYWAKRLAQRLRELRREKSILPSPP